VGVCSRKSPFYRWRPTRALATGEVRVATKNHSSGISQTNNIEAEPISGEPELPVGAFLIVDGTRLFPLEQSVDQHRGGDRINHLVIDDERISRTHAQLRVVQVNM